MEILDFLRGLVRPYIAYLFGLVLSVIVIWGFIKFADLDLYKIVLIAFIELVGIIIGFYYGQRQTNHNEPPTEPPTP